VAACQLAKTFGVSPAIAESPEQDQYPAGHNCTLRATRPPLHWFPEVISSVGRRLTSILSLSFDMSYNL
jgi:hypothetical protein